MEAGSQGRGWNSFFLAPMLHANNHSKDFQGCFQVHKMEKMFVFHITYVPTFKNVFLILLFHGEVEEALVKSVGGGESRWKPPLQLPLVRPCVRNKKMASDTVPTANAVPAAAEQLPCGRESPCK